MVAVVLKSLEGKVPSVVSGVLLLGLGVALMQALNLSLCLEY